MATAAVLPEACRHAVEAAKGHSELLPHENADGRGRGRECQHQILLRRGRGYSSLRYLLLKGCSGWRRPRPNSWFSAEPPKRASRQILAESQFTEPLPLSLSEDLRSDSA